MVEMTAGYSSIILFGAQLVGKSVEHSACIIGTIFVHWLSEKLKLCLFCVTQIGII